MHPDEAVEIVIQGERGRWAQAPRRLVDERAAATGGIRGVLKAAWARYLGGWAWYLGAGFTLPGDRAPIGAVRFDATPELVVPTAREERAEILRRVLSAARPAPALSANAACCADGAA
jgi:hypothetical protein